MPTPTTPPSPSPLHRQLSRFGTTAMRLRADQLGRMSYYDAHGYTGRKWHGYELTPGAMRIVARPLIVAVRLNVSCKISTMLALLHTFGSYASKRGVGEKVSRPRDVIQSHTKGENVSRFGASRNCIPGCQRTHASKLREREREKDCRRGQQKKKIALEKGDQ
jgi:hypothetical protein